MQINSLAWCIATLWVMLLLGGCNTTPTKEETPVDSRLSELQGGGRSGLLAMLPPVRSSAEAAQLGDAALRAGKREEALLHFVRAVELDPQDYVSLHKIGVIHGLLGGVPLASLAYQMALEVNPGYVPSREKLGLLFLENRKSELARKHLEQAVSLDPDRWRSHNGLGVLADLNGDHAEAEHDRAGQDVRCMVRHLSPSSRVVRVASLHVGRTRVERSLVTLVGPC